MAGSSPEQSKTTPAGNMLRKIISIGEAIVIPFRERWEYELKERRSKRYVDSLFECYVKGTMTVDEFLNDTAPKKVEELGLSWYTAQNQSFYRCVSFHWFGETEGLKVNWKRYQKPS